MSSNTVFFAKNILDLYSWISASPSFLAQSYPDRFVNSIYFETLNKSSENEILVDSVDKTKVRLRWYGSSTPISHLEVKKKNGYVCDKKSFFQVQSPNLDIKSRILTARSCYVHEHSVLEFLLNPVLWIGYERTYFASNHPNFEGFRVTVDRMISYAEIRDEKIYGSKILESDDVILEVKFPVSLYEKASPLLRSINCELTKNSKFTSGVMGLNNIYY
ncbi:VTC domain-containing protein [Polynucleobacter sp. 39-46-10]|jgi:SPX domain protein involved in polyphosphate accumulation|uniref:VTC domain-containing protein n=1 Tax=Polynucleobacter sp. 39-46-10 TaxID=1970428 RepID=UPI000BC4AB72|nr:VTC domain-containing protein [Polynucleobacter sp. 39-46-10]OZA75838.1 MAG: hypothetical protein B7X71_10430 [Polynucleobacter sp. 39-46-10]